DEPSFPDAHSAFFPDCVGWMQHRHLHPNGDCRGLWFYPHSRGSAVLEYGSLILLLYALSGASARSLWQGILKHCTCPLHPHPNPLPSRERGFLLRGILKHYTCPLHPHPGPLPSRERGFLLRGILKHYTCPLHPHPGPLPSRERGSRLRGIM